MEYRKKKGSYMFTNKKHPLEAVLACIIAIAIVITIGILSYFSSKTGGNGPLLYGIISFWVMWLALANFVISLFSLRKKEIFYLFPILGTVLNGLLFFGLFMLYMIGFTA